MEKIVFLYPGQGSQFIGMGIEFYTEFECARILLEEASDSLQMDLKAILFSGTHDELTLTVHAQPALLITSLMAQAVLNHEMRVPFETVASYLVGHSLGEYSALCVGGVLSFIDTLRLVKIRSNAMQNAVAPGIGTMAAILGLNLDEVEEIIQSFTNPSLICTVANDNSPGQVVISGHNDAVIQATQLAKQRGAKRTVMLPVSAPFHSPLMEEVSHIMKQVLSDRNLVLNPIRIPIVMNVNAQLLSDSTCIPELMAHQVTGRVRFRESIQMLYHSGCRVFVEMGAGKVLTNLVKRTLPDVIALPFNTPDDCAEIFKRIEMCRNNP